MTRRAPYQILKATTAELDMFHAAIREVGAGIGVTPTIGRSVTTGCSMQVGEVWAEIYDPARLGRQGRDAAARQARPGARVVDAYDTAGGARVRLYVVRERCGVYLMPGLRCTERGEHASHRA